MVTEALCGRPDTAIMSKRSRTPSPSTYSRSPISSNIAPPERTKIIHREPVPVIEAMHCALPPHRETLSFASYEDYEVHYQQAHVNRCAECSKNFPTGHFLNLHIEENHDALAAARKARGDKTVSVQSLNSIISHACPHFMHEKNKEINIFILLKKLIDHC